MPLSPGKPSKGIKKKPKIDEDALALEVGQKMLAHYRREGGIRLSIFDQGDAAQANLGYANNMTTYTVEIRSHPLVALLRTLDLRTPGFIQEENKRLADKDADR